MDEFGHQPTLSPSDYTQFERRVIADNQHYDFRIFQSG
jgi:hypothetical protein